MIIPVILSGGSGTRLWPVSTTDRPKQFQVLLGDQTMIAETAARVSERDYFAAPIVIGNADHESLLAECLAATPPQLTILEPQGRNTAAAIAIAALTAQSMDPDAIIAVLPSDHVVRDRRGFVETTLEAARIARMGYLVTYGIVPNEPHTGYGYIERGDKAPGIVSASRIARFIEKPDRATAEKLLAQGGYSWNSGMFVFQAATVLAEFEKYAPELLATCRATLAASPQQGNIIKLDVPSFAQVPSIAFDKAIMEKTGNAMVLPALFDWSDVGSWWALHDMLGVDERGNVVHGYSARVDQDVSNCYVRNDTSIPLFVTGLDEVVVVVTDAGIVVTSKASEQNVKKATEIYKN